MYVSFALQKELFLGKTDPGSGSPPRIEKEKDRERDRERERKLSSSSSSMKTKWLKAFRSLKPATAIASTVKYVFLERPNFIKPNNNFNMSTNNCHVISLYFNRKNDQTNNSRRVVVDGENHNLQEYTYKKITPCDVCSQVLRGKHIKNILVSFSVFGIRFLFSLFSFDFSLFLQAL